MTAGGVERCDVLVVGAGGAGLRAAIAAHEADPALDVLLINKGPLGATGTTALAFSDRMAFHATLPHTAPIGEDAWKYHARDIFEIGGRVSDGDLADILAQRSAETFDYLVGLGVPFVMEHGRARQFVTDGSDYARACYTGPDTAAQIERALLRRLRQTPVRRRDDLMLADIAVGDRGVEGAVAILWQLGTVPPWTVPKGGVGARHALPLQPSESRDSPSTRAQSPIVPIAAPAVVLCTGGPGSIFGDSVYPPGMTGDGHAAAYRAGAELVNMEFIQIGLCSEHTNLACSGSIMRCVPRFVNQSGVEFLGFTRLRRASLPRLSPGDIGNLVFAKGATWPVSAEKPTRAIDIAVAHEISRGERVYLDFSRDPEGFSWETLRPEYRARFAAEAGEAVNPASTPVQRLLQINAPAVEWLAERLIDLRAGERLQITPKVQHFQGGVKINGRAETTVPGLFAAGECAGGQHGANRPGGNALLDTQVFGRIAGESAARRAARAGDCPAVDCPQGRGRGRGKACLARTTCGKPGQPRGETAGAALALAAEGLAARLMTSHQARRGVSRQVGRILSRAASVVRTEARLKNALRALASLAARGVAGETRAAALEALNALTAAEMILHSALMRDESRGPHLRFASADDLDPLPSRPEWERYIVIRAGGAGAMHLEVRTPTLRPQPAAKQPPA